MTLTRRGLVLLATAAVSAAVIAWLASRQGAVDGPAVANGQALFQGQAALSGRLAGHAQALPTSATRCVNCHGRPADSAAAARAAGNAGWTTPVAPTAPWLDRASLAQPRVRRGGPASAFDAAALCKLLRSGVDPSQIMIAGTMPRYEASDAQCAELWAYLSRQ